MKSIIALILIFFSFTFYSFGQEPAQILSEGKKLYHLEMASWYGTDYFLEKFPHKKNDIGGYVSYELDNQVVNIFFDKVDNNRILVRIYFAASPGKMPVSVDTVNNTASLLETELISMRLDALNRIVSNSDGFFSVYENTSFNPIPIISKNERKVYVLTAPHANGVVLLGNDYLLTYDQKIKLKKKKKIHNSLIELPFKDEHGNEAITTIHSHVNSKYMDPTDICTLLLYKDYVKWKQHYVMGKKYVSIFDMEKETLAVLTLKAWKKISQQGKN